VLQIFFVCVYVFVFAVKARFQVLNFPFCQIKLSRKTRKTGKISLKLDSNVSLLLEYGRKSKMDLYRERIDQNHGIN